MPPRLQVNHEFVVVDARTFLTSEQQSLQVRRPCGERCQPPACWAIGSAAPGATGQPCSPDPAAQLCGRSAQAGRGRATRALRSPCKGTPQGAGGALASAGAPAGRLLTAAARQALFGAGGEAGNAYRVEVATIATRLATAFAALNVRLARAARPFVVWGGGCLCWH